MPCSRIWSVDVWCKIWIWSSVPAREMLATKKEESLLHDSAKTTLLQENIRIFLRQVTACAIAYHIRSSGETCLITCPVQNIVNWAHVWFVKVCCMSSGINVVHTICDLSYLWNRIRGLSRVYSAMVCMNRQESAEGDVVKREDGVARAFRVQPIPAIEVSGYIWIFRTSKCSGFWEEEGGALRTKF